MFAINYANAVVIGEMIRSLSNLETKMYIKTPQVLRRMQFRTKVTKHLIK